MKCIKCGKKEAEIGFLCKECFFEEIKIRQKRKEIKICPVCGRAIVGKKTKTIEDRIKELLNKELISLDPKIEFEIKKSKLLAKLKIGSKEKHVSFFIKEEVCEYCKMRTTSYFEAIIQIRGKNREKIEKDAYFLFSSKKYESKNVFITTTKYLKEGIDLYITDKKSAISLAKTLAKKHKKHLLFSTTDKGIDESGKKKTRLTILLKDKEEKEKRKNTKKEKKLKVKKVK